MWARLDKRYISGSMGIATTSRMEKTEKSPVAEHFSGEGHTLADVTSVAINEIYSHDSCLRKIHESRRIRTLGSSHSSGINLMVNSL